MGENTSISRKRLFVLLDARRVRTRRKIRSRVILPIPSLIPLRILNNVLRNKITANHSCTKCLVPIRLVMTMLRKWSTHEKDYTAMEKLLGDKTFFGGDKPSIADFRLCASIYSWERNTKGNESQAHVYAAHAAALKNAVLSKWADTMGDELKEYLAN